MKKCIAILFLLLFLVHPLIGRDIVCEVSSQFRTVQVSKDKYRFNDIKSAFEFANNCPSSKTVRIVLCDKKTFVKSPINLFNNKGRIIVKAKRGIAEIINGQIVDVFEQKGDTLFFTANGCVSNISIKGEFIPMATTFTNASELKQFKSFKSIGKDKYSAVFPNEELEIIEKGCDVFVYCRWLCHKLKVEDVNKNTGEVTMICHFNPVYASDATAYYSIFNSRKVLKPNTFCNYEGHVYYLKKTVDLFDNPEIRVPFSSTFVCINGCDNVTFENIAFRGGAVEEWYVEGVQGARNLPRAVIVQNSSNVVFKNCDFSNNDGYSLGIDNSYNCSVTGCAFTRLGGGGIALGFGEKGETHNITIDNNLFKGMGRIHPGAEAIITYKTHDIKITNNTICDGFYSGIGLGFTWGYGGLYSYNIYVANNHIHHVMRGVLSDGGGIYTLGNQRGTVIENNCIHDVISRVFSESGSSLLYFDEGSSDIVAKNNVLFGAHTGFHENYGRRNTLENNVIAYTNLVTFRLSNAKLDTMLIAKKNYVLIDKGTAFNSIFASHAIYEDNKTIEGVVLNKETGTQSDNYSKLDDINSSIIIKELYRRGLLKKNFGYGVKSNRLKNMEMLSDEIIKQDKDFVVTSFPQVSEYFNR